MFDRASGRTYRIANEIIDDFFNDPMGSKIAIVDHYPGRNASEMLADLVARRITNDFPDTEFKIDKSKETITIQRLTKTYQEKVVEEVAHENLMRSLNKPTIIFKFPNIDELVQFELSEPAILEPQTSRFFSMAIENGINKLHIVISNSEHVGNYYILKDWVHPYFVDVMSAPLKAEDLNAKFVYTYGTETYSGVCKLLKINFLNSSLSSTADLWKDLIKHKTTLHMELEIIPHTLVRFAKLNDIADNLKI